MLSDLPQLIDMSYFVDILIINEPTPVPPLPLSFSSRVSSVWNLISNSVASSTMADEATEEECRRSLIMSRLSLLSFPVHSPVHDDSSGCSTPPFHIPASVPFKWEEEPGKPIPCTALIHFTESISLHLTPPPRMVVASLLDSKQLTTKTKTNTASPTTFLDRPSLRPERGLLGAMVMSDVNKKEMGMMKRVGRRRLFGNWSWRPRKSKKSGEVSKRDGFGGSFVFPSSASASFDDGRECCSEYGGESECATEQVNVSKMKKSKSFLSLIQVMTWNKGIKLKMELPHE